MALSPTFIKNSIFLSISDLGTNLEIYLLSFVSILSINLFIQSKNLKQSLIPAHLLELEITEGVLMTGHTYIGDAIEQLHLLGIKLSMDDFGTGYSSLNYLRQYPFNILKIDRCFVEGLNKGNKDKELVIATIAMAHALGLKVVAEGVETEDQLEALTELKCDIVQGYLLARPMQASALIEMSEHHLINEKLM